MKIAPKIGILDNILLNLQHTPRGDGPFLCIPSLSTCQLEMELELKIPSLPSPTLAGLELKSPEVCSVDRLPVAGTAWPLSWRFFLLKESCLPISGLQKNPPLLSLLVESHKRPVEPPKNKSCLFGRRKECLPIEVAAGSLSVHITPLRGPLIPVVSPTCILGGDNNVICGMFPPPHPSPFALICSPMLLLMQREIWKIFKGMLVFSGRGAVLLFNLSD